MAKARLKTILVTTCLIFVASSAIGQMGSLVTVSGRVIDPSGKWIDRAFVNLSNPATHLEFRAQTDSTGTFTLLMLSGVYHLRVDPPQGSDLISKEIMGFEVISEVIPQQRNFIPGEVIVRFQPDVIKLPAGKSNVPIQEVTVMDSAVAELNRQVGVTHIRKVFPNFESADTLATALDGTQVILIDLSRVYLLQVPISADIRDVVKRYQSLSKVEYAEPNYISTVTGYRVPVFMLEREVWLDLYLAPESQRKQTLFDVKPGTTFDVEIVAKARVAGATGFTARLEFDPKKLTYVSFKVGDLIPNLQGLPYLRDGIVEVGGAILGGGQGAIRDSGTLVTMRFQVSEDLAGTALLTFTSASLKRGNQRELFTLNKAVSIQTFSELPGDFDGSGVVDFDDFFLFAIAFGKKKEDQRFESKFDMNQNDEIDFNDFFLFADAFGKSRKAGKITK